MMTEKVFRVTIVGYGLSAKVFQLPFVPLVPQLQLYGIVQRSPKINDDAANDHPDLKVYRTFSEAIRDPLVDVVVLGTSSHTHFALCKAALEAGKHGLYVPERRRGEASLPTTANECSLMRETLYIEDHRG